MDFQETMNQEKHVSPRKDGSGDQDQEYSELLYRLYMRERDPELRQLMNRLQAAYIFRDQRQHILNSEYSRLQNKVGAHGPTRVQIKELEALRKEQEKADRSTEYCHQLQQQLAEKQQIKDLDYNDLVREMNMIDELINVIADDDQRELQLKQALTEKIHGEMMAFKQERSDRSDQLRETERAEDVRIMEQLHQASERTSHFKSEREYRMQEKVDLNDIAVAKLEADEARREETHEALRQSETAEYNQRQVTADQERWDTMDGVRRDQFNDMNKMLDNKKRLVEEHRQNDRDDRRKMDAKCLAEEERHQQAEASKRQTNMQYGDDLKRQIEENRLRKLKLKQEERDRDVRDSRFDQGWSNHGRSKVEDEIPVERGVPACLQDDEGEDLESGVEELHLGSGDHASVSPGQHRFSDDKAQCDAQFRNFRNY